MREKLNIFKFACSQVYLNAVLQARCLRNSRYSLRAFARDMKVSCGSLSEILNGKVKLSRAKAEQFAKYLGLSSEESLYLQSLSGQALRGASAYEEMHEVRSKHAYQAMDPKHWPGSQLSLKEFALVIVASLRDGFVIDPSLAQQMALSIDDLEAACRKLGDIGWLKADGEGRWTAPHGFIRSGGADASQGIRAFHRQLLALGMDQLESVPVEERFFTATLFSLSTADYQKLCQDVQRFILEHSDSIQSRDKHDRVYALGLQLLPITADFPSREWQMMQDKDQA